uniref:Uncharacterized protein n=6 Tax=Fusarium sambucinum species complex TaxID=569360 RepID=A0A098DPZ1_GIBZE
MDPSFLSHQLLRTTTLRRRIPEFHIINTTQLYKFDIMAVFGSFRKWLALKQYQLEVTFSVYMFTPWEKFFFSSIVFLLFSLTFIAACLYLPHHISFLVGRAWYYMNGEQIDVAEVVQEAVKDMSASALSGATASAVDVTKETIEIVKEL